MATETNSIEHPQGSDSKPLETQDKKIDHTVTRVFQIAELTFLELLKAEILKVAQLEKPQQLSMKASEEPSWSETKTIQKEHIDFFSGRKNIKSMFDLKHCIILIHNRFNDVQWKINIKCKNVSN